MPKYQPKIEDILWAENMIALLKDGGTLAYPCSQSIYIINKKNKKLVLQNPNPSEEEIHQQTVEVFKRVGYEVQPVSCLEVN